MVLVGNRAQTTDSVALTRWFDQAHVPWSPVRGAERQFDFLVDSEDVPDRAAYDHLYEMADLAVRWLADNPCPDAAIGRRFEAQMMAYRAVADTVRSTFVAEEGNAMVAQLSELRAVIEQHSESIDELTPTQRPVGPDTVWEEGGSIVQFRRREPRQPASWDGVCQIEGQSATPCKVIDISMLGLGLTLNHASPSRLVGHRISVNVPAIGDSVSIQLEGRIKNATAIGDGAVRLGIEFDRPSGSESGASGSRGTTSLHKRGGVGHLRGP